MSLPLFNWVPATIFELAERVNVPWDESKQFKYYLNLAEKYRRVGKEFARSGDMENVFVGQCSVI
jgi:STAM-binding protein